MVAAAHDLPPRSAVAAATALPLGLLPEPRRARVTEVSSAHHEEVGGLPEAPPDIPSPLRTSDPRPLQARRQLKTKVCGTLFIYMLNQVCELL